MQDKPGKPDNKDYIDEIVKVLVKGMEFLDTPPRFFLFFFGVFVVGSLMILSTTIKCGEIANEAHEARNENLSQLQIREGSFVQLRTDLEMDGINHKTGTCGLVYSETEEHTSIVFLNREENGINPIIKLFSVFSLRDVVEIPTEEIKERLVYVKTNELHEVYRALVLNYVPILIFILVIVTFILWLQSAQFNVKLNALYLETKRRQNRKEKLLRVDKLYEKSKTHFKESKQLMHINSDSNSWYKAIDIMLELLEEVINEFTPKHYRVDKLVNKIRKLDNNLFENKNELLKTLVFINEMKHKRTDKVFNKLKLEEVLSILEKNLNKLGLDS